MNSSPLDQSLEGQIDQWRNYLRRRQAVQSSDIGELEDHLREQIKGLVSAGLAPDEAFIVAVKRLGALDALSREFAREHSERLWKQLVMPSSESEPSVTRQRKETVVAVGLAAAAGAAVKIPALFGLDLNQDSAFYFRNLALFVLPLLAGYFIWKRKLGLRTAWTALAAFLIAAVVANGYPFKPQGWTETLAALHLPIALWGVVGLAYAGRRWREVAGRMDFIRFTGELVIYYTLIGLGGGVLTGFVAMIFQSIGVNPEFFFSSWLLPCGAAGAVLIAAWLVEAKQSVIENMAPVLTRLFTPMFAAALLVFLATMLWTGHGINIEREVLIAFDMLLVVVLGLLVYAISARSPNTAPGPFDVLQVVLLISALLADAVALGAIATRITEFGFTPNRVAALGENVILLVNLAWSTVLYVRYLRGQETFSRLERWQTDYLPVYVAWATIVSVIFPPLFGFI